VVVADGLTLVEPLGDVELKLPGEIWMLVAPVADQLSVVLAPEWMLAGLAAKEEIAGAEPLPGGVLEEPTVAQPATKIKRQRADKLRTMQELQIRRTERRGF
jgi:hypothetical protein